MTDDGYRECARGPNCQGATQDGDGEWWGAPSPRVFCDPCTTLIRRALSDLPAVYRELRELLTDTTVGGFDETAVTVPRVDPPAPIRVDVDETLTTLEGIVTMWEHRVRDVVGLPPAPVRVSWANMGQRVDDACRLLHQLTTTLIGLPMEPMVLPDGTTDERGGADAGLDLLDIHRDAHRLAAPTRPVFVIPVPCPRCQVPWVKRRGGDDHAWCGQCGHTIPAPEYQDLARGRLEEGRIGT